MNKEYALLSWIQEWIYMQCNGDWEHNNNFHLQTIDNPGWSLFINLEETNLENKEFIVVDSEKNLNDWIYCRVENKKFKGACGSLNLTKLLDFF